MKEKRNSQTEIGTLYLFWLNRTEDLTFRTLHRSLSLISAKHKLLGKNCAKGLCSENDINEGQRIDWRKQRKSQTVHEYWRKVVFSDKGHTELDASKHFNIWRKEDEKYIAHLICPRPERKINLMIWGRICYDGIETVTAVEGNINQSAIKVE